MSPSSVFVTVSIFRLFRDKRNESTWPNDDDVTISPSGNASDQLARRTLSGATMKMRIRKKFAIIFVLSLVSFFIVFYIWINNALPVSTIIRPASGLIRVSNCPTRISNCRTAPIATARTRAYRWPNCITSRAAAVAATTKWPSNDLTRAKNTLTWAMRL